MIRPTCPASSRFARGMASSSSRLPRGNQGRLLLLGAAAVCAVAAAAYVKATGRGQFQRLDTALPVRTREVLDGSQQLVLYSLNPLPPASSGARSDERLHFHGYPV